MNILLVSATKAEIFPFLKNFNFPENDAKSFSVKYKNHVIDVLITGVGMVATAFALGKAFHKRYDLAINAGLAGSFRRDIELGTVVNVMQDRFTEMGVEDGDSFLGLAEIKLMDENEFPFQKSEVKNEFSLINNFLKKLPEAKGITVNTVHGNEISIQKIAEKFNPDTESMEGAAFLYCCLQEGVPCAQVRAISNYVERRNRDAWNIPLAIENLNRKIIEIMQELA
jgi:futalosine hydrolase